MEHKSLSFMKYVGPGLLVTVGFIDPGNWASNVSAGSEFGYKLLWVVTLSTLMLIVLQHNAAHLGIATGYCLSEACSVYLHPILAKLILGSALIASISTALAEILGASIAISILFKIPIKIGAVLTTSIILIFLFNNSYKRLEKWIIGFVSIIGLSFLIQLTLVHIPWIETAKSFVTPAIPKGAMPIIMSILGAVVMPHNLFLHSEIIQSRKWNLEEEAVIKKQLKFEFMDTIISMIIGWAINSAMIIIAAAVFFSKGINITDIAEAEHMLKPLLGNGAGIMFALALLFSGISSSVTAGMAGGSIFAGIKKEPYDIENKFTKYGVVGTLIGALIAVFFIKDTFQGLVFSQLLLSIQLPLTILLQIYLTSSKKVMGKYANSVLDKLTLIIIAVVVIGLNIKLLIS